MVIFEKVALGRFSFFNSILQYAVFLFSITLLKINNLGDGQIAKKDNKPKLRRAKVRI